MDDIEQVSLPELRIFVLDIPEKSHQEVLSGQIGLAAKAGFNGVLVPFFRQGCSFYKSLVSGESKTPPIRKDLKKTPDLFWSVFESAFLSRVRVWAYIDPLSLSDRIAFAFGYSFFKRKKWLSLNKTRKPFPIGFSEKNAFLCVYNEDVRRFVADIAVEITEKFPVNGIVLDMSCNPHYSDISANAPCFCDSCRKKVKEDLSHDLHQILLNPADSAFRRWNRWKNERLLSFIEYVSERVRKVRSGIPFLTMVPGELANLRESGVENGGEPRTWAAQGLVSSLVTRYHPESSSVLLEKVNKDIVFTMNDVPLIPSIRAENASELASRIAPLRALPLFGFICAMFGPLTEGDSEALSQGVFRAASLDSLSDILSSAKCLIQFILRSSKPHSALNGFLRDILSYIDNGENITLDKTQSILDDLDSIEQKFKTGDLDAGFLPSRTLRDISVIKNLIRTSVILSR